MRSLWQHWSPPAGLARKLWSNGRDGPVRVTAILTERCHLRCDFCRLWEDPRHGVSREQWAKVFRANPGLRWVNLSGGEIFAREQLLPLLEDLIEALPRLTLLDFPTAGQKPEAVKEVVELVRDRSPTRLVVTVSLDGGPPLHDELRGVEGSFERALETYRQLRERQDRQFSVRIGCTLTNQAAQQVQSLRSALQRRLPDFEEREVHYNLAHHSGHYYRNQSFTALPEEAALQQLERVRLRPDPLSWLEWVYGKLARSSLREGFPRVGCESIRHTLFIGPDLTVYPCSIWDHPLGNLRDYDHSLARLVQQEPVKEARRQIDRQQCPGCFSPCEAVPAMLAHPLRATLAAWRESRP